MGYNDERDQTLNQLLTELDGFQGRQGILFLAATNRMEILDPALLRPGRINRKVRPPGGDLPLLLCCGAASCQLAATGQP